jgi:hypothetical protein
MKGLRVMLPVAAFIGAVLLAATLVWSQPGTTTTVPQVSARAATVNNMPVGEVMIGDVTVLNISRPAGGYTALERANIVAGRLTTLLNQGFTWNDVQVGRMNGETVLLMGNNLLVTADSVEARAMNISTQQLAQGWQQNLRAALNPTPTTAVAGTTESWPTWTNPATKIVPIISLGTPGVSLGGAQVTGPADLVNQVKSVVQLSVVFQRTARVFAFVPSSEIAGLQRVQGVAVSALLQYQLVKF